MYPYVPDSYNQLSSYILNLLGNLSSSIKYIDGIIDELLDIDKLNKNGDFLKFVLQFNQGRYYQFKGEGYMECIVATEFYTPEILCYWLNNILSLTIRHFSKALIYLDEIKKISSLSDNEDFQKLLKEFDKFTVTFNAIIETSKLYNIAK